MTLNFETIKSKIMEIFKDYNTYKGYYVKIGDDIVYFKEYYSEKIQIDDNKCEYILFKIDIYFSDYSLVVDIEKEDREKYTVFELKRQAFLTEYLDCEFIRINDKDLDCEIRLIQNFINEFDDNKIEYEIKQLRDKIKELERENSNLLGKMLSATFENAQIKEALKLSNIN